MNTSLYRNFPFYSHKLQDTISVEIALPDGYDGSPNKAYPSIYLLDANYFFDDEPGTLDDYLIRGEGMTKIVRTLAANGKIPSSILIGIGYTEDQRSKFTLEDVAGFYKFFIDELIPEIESKYRVSKSGNDRVLFGYSGSAHFSTYAFLNDVYTDVETFNKVISVSGVYFDSLEAYKLEEKVFRRIVNASFSKKSLFIAVGAEDPKVELLNTHRVFTKKMSSRGYADFNLFCTEFPGKGHYDIPEFAFSEGLTWLFAEHG